MTERPSGDDKEWDLQRIRRAVTLLGWATAITLVGLGVALEKRDYVTGGVVVGLLNVVGDTALDIVLDVGGKVKADLFGPSAKAA